MSGFNSVLYSKNMEPAEAISHEEMWDDSLLIRHYDEVKAKLDRKRRGLQSETSVGDTDQSETNMSEQPTESNLLESNVISNSKKKNRRRKGKKKEFQVGEYCRSRFSEDGLIYEAKILEVNKVNSTCKIAYVGYENEDVVASNCLMRTLGESSRMRQISEAERLGYGSNDSMFGDGSSVSGSDLISDSDSRANKRRRNISSVSSANLPSMPHLPDLPPPPAIGFGKDDPQSEALHTMLMSWYMTGYHTGYYQGLHANKSKHSK